MIKIKVKGLDKVLLEIDKWQKETERVLDNAVLESAVYTRDEAVKNISRKYPEGAVDTGILKSSLSYQKDPIRPHVYRVGAIGRNADIANRYAKAVEVGRRPGTMPPVGDSPQEGLWRWVLRHGWYNTASVKRGGKPSVFQLSRNKEKRIKQAKSIAFLIARKIKEKGTKPRPYLIPAYNKGVVYLIQKMDNTLT